MSNTTESQQPLNQNQDSFAAAPDSESFAPAEAPKQSTKTRSSNRSRKNRNPDSKEEGKNTNSTLRISNLSKLVGSNELKNCVLEAIGNEIKLVSANIVYYGPNPTGKAKLVFQTPEDSKKAIKILEGLLIRSQPIICSFEVPQKQSTKKPSTKKEKTKENIVEELKRFQKKYPTDYEAQTHEGFRTVCFSMSPSDPDFPFDIDSFKIMITIPDNYPSTPCKVEVLNDDVPLAIRKNITEKVDERAKSKYIGRPMLIGLMRFLDENLDVFLIDKKLTQIHKFKQIGFEIIAPNQKSQKSTAQPEIQVSKDITIEEYLQELQNQQTEGLGQVYSSNKSEEQKRVAQVNNCPTVTRNKGTQILADKVSMKGTGIMECITLRVVVVCENCKRHIDMAFSEAQPIQSLECPKCQMAISVTFRKDFIHEQSNVIGYFDISEACCTPFDYYPSDFRVTCLECGVQTSVAGITYDGKTIDCRSCFAKIFTKIEGVKFKKIKKPSNPFNEEKEKKKKKDTLTGGQPLPNNGTCQHFRKSKRWMRFPCCYKLFPCDLCHEEAKMDHDMIRATRMVCGFCSREQPFTNNPCISCGQDVSGTGGSSHFWEGGAGCRNKTSMARNDPHKFKGSQKKTHSKKVERVGEKKKAGKT
jgi:hypothetical protein